MLCWSLPYINMNQPQVYICLLPPEPPSHLPPHPTPLGGHRAHFELPAYVHACSIASVVSASVCMTLCTVAPQAALSMGVLQARILDWVATPSSRTSSQPRDGSHVSYVSCFGRWVLYH